MLFPCFFHPFCRSHTSTAFWASKLHCKGQLSKPWQDILLYQDKKQKKDPKRNNQDPSEERVEMKRFTWRIHASRRKKNDVHFPQLFHTFFNWWQNLLMVKASDNVNEVGISMFFSVLLNGRNKLMRSEYRKPAFHSFSILFQSFLNFILPFCLFNNLAKNGITT